MPKEDSFTYRDVISRDPAELCVIHARIKGEKRDTVIIILLSSSNNIICRTGPTH